MKKILFLAMIALVMSTSSFQAKAQVSAAVNFQFFYDNLSVHGTWISDPGYGYVWQPAVPSGFHPYRTNGHWVWSDEYEWVWVSDYDWGWAPFHYGRWHHDPYRGWLWVPGYEWSPAWVVWRGGNDYYGWAPLDPGISVSFTWGNYYPSYDYWSFVPVQYITSPVIYNYYVSPGKNKTMIRNTTIITNYRTNGGPSKNVLVNGPSRTQVEKFTGQKMKPVKLNESSSPGRTAVSNDAVSLYKPKVNAADKRSAKPANFVAADKGNKRNQPVKDQAVKEQPVRKEQQVKDQLQKTQPVRQEKSQPVKAQPMKQQQQKTQPVKQQPQKTQPVRNESVKPQQQKTQPIKMEQPRQQKSQPTRVEPVRQQQQKSQPVRNEPKQQSQPKGKKNGY